MQKTFNGIDQICKFQNEQYSNVSCGHCRFRKTVVSVKSLAVNKVEKSGISKVITTLLCMHSFDIIDFILKQLGKNWKDEPGEKQTKNTINKKYNQCIIETTKPVQKYSVPSIIEKFSYNPINKLHLNLMSSSQNKYMQNHLHNRFNHPDKITIIEINQSGKWMMDTGVTVSDSRMNSIRSQFENFKALDRKIFGDLLKNVLDVQLQEQIINFQNRSSFLEHYKLFIAECISEFHLTLSYIRLLASENDNGELLAAPYGKLSLSKTLIFRNLTLEWLVVKIARMLISKTCKKRTGAVPVVFDGQLL